MNKSKAKVVISSFIGIIQIVAGIWLAFGGGLCTLIAISDFEEFGIAALMCFLIVAFCGAFLARAGIRRRRLAKNFKLYVSVISGGNDYIPTMAQSLAMSEDTLKKNLEQLISKKYFVDAYLDVMSNRIIVNGQNRDDDQPASPNADAPRTASPHSASEEKEYVTVKCAGCGGINSVQKGHTAECEYCGSAIQG
ncbi:MAG: hypothetical protein LUI14_00575 [Lachnospiraceae bacterium]|nr:hypothetical protein [Lachnospiraceae bacterium]